MTAETARGYRQLLYTLLFVIFLRACTPWDEWMLNHTTLDGAEPRVTITVSPRFQHAPMGGGGARVNISVRVPRTAQNRRIRVEVDGTKFRAFEQDCSLPDGACGGFWPIRDLPAGDYEARAILLAWEGEWKTYSDRFVFQILE